MKQDFTAGSSQNDIRLLYAEPEHASPGSCFGPIVRSVYIIECCTGGRGSVIINGREFPVEPGMCYALLPGDAVTHTCSPEAPRQGYWCALDGMSVGTYLETARISSTAPYIARELYAPVLSWMEQMVQHWPCRDAGAQLRQTACAYGLLGTILQNRPIQENNTLIDMAIGLMQTHYQNPLTVAQLAQQVGLERTYFSDLFKQKAGLAPYQYLTRLRVQKACQLLMQGYSIAETAELVGIDSHNFGRVFKKEVGYSPTRYLQKLSSNPNNVVARSVRLGPKPSKRQK